MPGLVIPVTVLVTFIALELLNHSFNLMTLGGTGGRGWAGDRRRHRGGRERYHCIAMPDRARFQAIRSALSEITVPLIGSTDHADRGLPALDRNLPA